MRIGRRNNRVAGAWFGGVAILVQALVPLLVAAEIRLTAVGELPAAHAPISHAQAAAHHHQQSGGAHRHPVAHGCPLCQAVAAGQGFILAAAPPAPLPVVFVTLVAAVAVRHSPQSLFSVTYQARAPPQSR